MREDWLTYKVCGVPVWIWVLIGIPLMIMLAIALASCAPAPVPPTPTATTSPVIQPTTAITVVPPTPMSTIGLSKKFDRSATIVYGQYLNLSNFAVTHHNCYLQYPNDETLVQGGNEVQKIEEVPEIYRKPCRVTDVLDKKSQISFTRSDNIAWGETVMIGTTSYKRCYFENLNDVGIVFNGKVVVTMKEVPAELDRCK